MRTGLLILGLMAIIGFCDEINWTEDETFEYVFYSIIYGVGLIFSLLQDAKEISNGGDNGDK